MIAIQSSPGGATFAVKVTAGQEERHHGRGGRRAEMALTAPPVDGKANEACVEFFAKLLNVPRSSVTIAAGLTGRNKVIRVAGLSAAQVRERLGI